MRHTPSDLLVCQLVRGLRFKIIQYPKTFFFFLDKKKYNTENYPTLVVRPDSVILSIYMPAMSILTKHKISGLGGESNPTKSSFMVLPHLARAFAHRLHSLYAKTSKMLF